MTRPSIQDLLTDFYSELPDDVVHALQTRGFAPDTPESIMRDAAFNLLENPEQIEGMLGDRPEVFKLALQIRLQVLTGVFSKEEKNNPEALETALANLLLSLFTVKDFLELYRRAFNSRDLENNLPIGLPHQGTMEAISSFLMAEGRATDQKLWNAIIEERGEGAWARRKISKTQAMFSNI